MAKAIAQGNLVAITELMVKARGSQIETVVVREQSTVGFKLVIKKLFLQTAALTGLTGLCKTFVRIQRRSRGRKR